MDGQGDGAADEEKACGATAGAQPSARGAHLVEFSFSIRRERTLPNRALAVWLREHMPNLNVRRAPAGGSTVAVERAESF